MKATLPLQRPIRRLALTTKQAGKGYYKGNRTGSMGWHTKHGGYIVDPKKVRTYVVPSDLASFRLTPFVTKNLESKKGKLTEGQGPLNGDRYLSKWQEEGAGL